MKTQCGLLFTKWSICRWWNVSSVVHARRIYTGYILPRYVDNLDRHIYKTGKVEKGVVADLNGIDWIHNRMFLVGE
jgi:hypothetical protein